MRDEMVLYSDQEKTLGAEVSVIESQAESMVIVNNDDFTLAGNMARDIKAAQKKVEAYWEPMRTTTYNAYKAVTDHKKAMIDPLKNAEAILKKKMSAYQVEQERKRREQEEALKRLAMEELNRKLDEAAKAEENGDAAGAEYAMAEAEIMDTYAQTATVTQDAAKVAGVYQSKSWEIKNIDLSKLPDEFAGVLIRPADLKAIMQLIKASKGQIQIPGVEYEETVNFAVRAS